MISALTSFSRSNRPFWLIVFSILLALAGIFRLWQTIDSWTWLRMLGLSPLYLSISGGVWGVAGLAGAISLWLDRRWSAWVGRGLALFFALTYWLERLWLARAPGAGENWAFALLVTLLGLIYTFAVLALPARRKS